MENAQSLWDILPQLHIAISLFPMRPKQTEQGFSDPESSRKWVGLSEKWRFLQSLSSILRNPFNRLMDIITTDTKIIPSRIINMTRLILIIDKRFLFNTSDNGIPILK